MNRIIKFVEETLIISIIYGLITLFWQYAEFTAIRDIQPNEVDGFIASILTISIYINCKMLNYVVLKERDE